ncbi:DUF3488 and transglutaminase-like domain-containing protein [uncultured Demequina sp.]|uniref:transglutaminase family protein n=1 Tax=uncultured Demequina sp. TaxID=693499 RepID=UPI0025EC0D51|nr:DUF3488 and transglutaminase-like domain-containing protein [uncultured Demequina sp.]
MSAGAPRSAWAATPFIAVATFLGLFGLSTMLVMGPWMRTVGTVMLIATAVLVVTRLLSRSRVLPTLLAALAAAAVMVPLFARREDGSAHLLPTPGALADLGAALRGGVDYAAVTVAPAPESLELTALITAGTVALFLVAEHVAVSWRAAASAGLLLLIPWLPAVIFQHRVSAVALLCAIVAWLIAIAFARHTAGAERRPAVAGALTATAATMAGVLLVAPTALGGLGWGSIPRIDAPEGLETATRLNLALDLRTSLTTNSTTPVIVYSTEGPRPDALKLYSLTNFNGVQWARDDASPPARPADSGVLWPEPVDDWSERDRQRVDVQVLNLVEPNLPLPPSPRTLDIEGPWRYDATQDEVIGDGVTSRESSYSYVTDPDYVTPRSLRETQPAIEMGGDPDDPRYLEISPAIDETRVRDLSVTLTRDAETRYDQALAIQQFLRSVSEFTYDTSVSPSGGDAVSTFLDDRAGYCVQFATTMVIMARSLDIPARMAVGFLSGSATDADTFVVQGGDAHAWPELWFPGAGWVRFEPTPSIQTGLPPAYADPFANGTPIREEILSGEEVPSPEITAQAGNQATQEEDTTSSEVESAPVVPVWVIVALAAALAIAALAAWWKLRGHVRRRRAPTDAEGVWERLRESLPEPMRWQDTLTPHEAAEHVEAAVRTADAGLSGVAREALTRLANAVADERYAPAGSEVTIDELRSWSTTVLDEAQRADEGSRAAARN